MKTLNSNRGLFESDRSDDETIRKACPEPAEGMGHPECSERRKGEQGYLLLMVVVLAALVLIALAIAAPKIKAQIQRDHEQELKNRGMAYAHAIKLYYHKFNSYPVNINQLMNSNNIKFLRKKYSDPVTGLMVWRPVYFGQVGWGGSTNPNCSTDASSFGGTPGGSSSFGGSSTSPSSGIGGSSSGGLGGSPGSSSGFGSSSTTGCPDPSTTAATGSANSTTPNADGSLAGDGTSPATPTLGPNGLPAGTDLSSLPDPAGFLTPVSSFDGGGGQTATGGGFGSTPAAAFGSPGAAAGGGQIVGVASLSRKESIMSIKGKNHYNDLEFIYDPTLDYGGTAGLTGTGIGGAQQPASPFGTPTNGAPPVFGSGTPGSPTGPGTTTGPGNQTGSDPNGGNNNGSGGTTGNPTQ